MIPAIAFIPPDDVIDVFERLSGVSEINTEMMLMEFLITVITLTSVGSEETQLELPQCFKCRCEYVPLKSSIDTPHKQPYGGLTQEISNHLYVLDVYQLIEEIRNLEHSGYGTS